MANSNFGRAFREILESLGLVGGSLTVGEKLNEWKQNLQDLNPHERSELENIIESYQLKVSLAGCTTEHQALVVIIEALKASDPEDRRKIASAIDKVFALD